MIVKVAKTFTGTYKMSMYNLMYDNGKKDNINQLIANRADKRVGRKSIQMHYYINELATSGEIFETFSNEDLISMEQRKFKLDYLEQEKIKPNDLLVSGWPYYKPTAKMLAVKHCVKRIKEMRETKELIAGYLDSKVEIVLFGNLVYNFDVGELMTNYGLKYPVNAKRSKSKKINRMFDIALANDWDCFLTLTFDSDKQIEYNFEGIRNMKRRLKRQGYYFNYVGVVEKHKKGDIHLHLLVKTDCINLEKYKREKPVKYYDKKLKAMRVSHYHYKVMNKWFAETFGKKGFARIDGLTDKTSDKHINYMTKYLGKGDSNIIYSQGLKKIDYKRYYIYGDYLDILENPIVKENIFMQDKKGKIYVETQDKKTFEIIKDNLFIHSRGGYDTSLKYVWEKDYTNLKYLIKDSEG